MVGVASEPRSTVLLRFDGGGLPVCWAYSARFCAIAAAASGNMALMVDVSSPELRLLPAGDIGDLPVVLRELSTFNFDIASLSRLDMASGGHVSTDLQNVFRKCITLFSKIGRR